MIVILVCTGNTCRSPMAEQLLRAALSERLSCSPAELEDHGVTVISAGVAAATGAPPSSEAVDVMQEMGLDLRAHESRPLSEQLVRHADLMLTMTYSHQRAIIDHWPEAAERTRLVLPNETDVADPIGQSVAVYRECAEQISRGVKLQAERIATELL